MPTRRREYSLKSYDSTKVPALLVELQHALSGFSVEFRDSSYKPEVSVGKEALKKIAQVATKESNARFEFKNDTTTFRFRLFESGDLFLVFCTSDPADLSKIDDLQELVAKVLNLLPPSQEEAESTVNLYDLNKRVVRILKVVERWEGSASSLDLFRSKRCFFSFHFDEHGTALAYELRDFLEVIGIKFVSGQGYEPRSVSDKVLARLDRTIDLFIVIFTREEHVDWLQQEIGIAKGRELPIMVLIEGDVRFSSGILSDHEYVRFPNGIISKAFFPLIQALRFLEKKA